MTKVEDIMTSNISSVTPSTPILEVARKMRDSGSSTIPVCENGKLRGLITEKSIVAKIVAAGQNPKREQAASLMVNGIPKIPYGCDAVEAAKIMANHGVRYLPVVQNGGKLAGMLTLDDLVKEILLHYKNMDMEARSLIPLTNIYWPV